MNSILKNIFKLGGNICELIYYKVSLAFMKVAIAWNEYRDDYKRSVERVTEPRYIVEDSHKYSSGEPLYTNPIIQKEKGFI